jgi:hypothetical protein
MKDSGFSFCILHSAFCILHSALNCCPRSNRFAAQVCYTRCLAWHCSVASTHCDPLFAPMKTWLGQRRSLDFAIPLDWQAAFGPPDRACCCHTMPGGLLDV